VSRADFRAIAREHYQRQDYQGLFEDLYARVDGDASQVPWADMKAHPALSRWIGAQPKQATTLRALVVGCGLGDDAKALAAAGYDATGFDLSSTAVAWAQKRFGCGNLRFVTADLFDPPKEWAAGFDLVVEVYTLQALPDVIRSKAMDAVASFVAPGGRLLVVCRGRDEHEPAESMPFPLTRQQLDRFVQAGLVQQSFDDFMDEEDPPVRRFVVEYERPRT